MPEISTSRTRLATIRARTWLPVFTVVPGVTVSRRTTEQGTSTRPPPDASGGPVHDRHRRRRRAVRRRGEGEDLRLPSGHREVRRPDRGRPERGPFDPDRLEQG